MKLEPPKNINYCGTVVWVKTLVPLANCDNLVGMPMFGSQAIVSKDTQVGDLGVLFPAEVQLSDEYTRRNNLYRHGNLNADADKIGYLEDNRRVRAIKLRGHRSDALFMPLSSIDYILGFRSEPHYGLQEGDTFDVLNGHEICQKYIVPSRSRGLNARRPTKSRTDARFFPEQFDVPQYFRNVDHLDPNAWAVVTQKLHGTSIRVGNVVVQRKLSWLERFAARLGVRVQKTAFDYVYGSHHMIKDANDPSQRHFYNEDIWTVEGRKLDGLIPENYVVYGELVGWTSTGEPIQKHYTYDCLPKTCRLYVYRVMVVNAQGVAADLSWDAVKEFCQSVGLSSVPELQRGLLKDIDVHNYLDHKFHQESTGDDVGRREPIKLGWRRALPLAPDSPCDEGICIRIEGMIPQILKAKSPIFLQHETKMIDMGEADIEAGQDGSNAE